MKQKQASGILYVLVLRGQNDHGYIYDTYCVCYLSGARRTFVGSVKCSSRVWRFICDHMNKEHMTCLRRNGECLITASDEGVRL